VPLLGFRAVFEDVSFDAGMVTEQAEQLGTAIPAKPNHTDAVQF
jgi:hypothetical protein